MHPPEPMIMSKEFFIFSMDGLHTQEYAEMKSKGIKMRWIDFIGVYNSIDLQ
jgi:hypothetical protein